MNFKNLHLNVDFLGSSGVILSQEQKAALQSSLIVVQNEGNFSDLCFWGKILGLGGDYYIVQGINEKGGLSRKRANRYFSQHRTLYSQDCVNWGLLTPATKEMKEKASFIRGRFSGVPSYAFEQISSSRNPELDSESKITLETITLKEEDRLAAVIASIDRDCMIVPRGSYVQDSTGRVYRNRTFEGLSLLEATKFQYYCHFRKPIGLTDKTLLQRASLDKSIDFMDNIEDDIPQGRWSIQLERGGGVVTLRNLEWLGYTFYHIPGTREFGSAYIGTGERNIDLPFML